MFSKKLFIFFFLFVILFLTACVLNNKVQEEEKVMPAKSEKTISLPKPKISGELSVEEAIKRRRSRRDFKDKALTLGQISQILWSAQGITDKEKGLRSAPSAGALYPLELYLVVSENGVENLEAEVYHFSPSENNLKRVVDGDFRQDLAEAGLGQSAIRQAPASIVITAIYERTTQKYGDRGEKYVHAEVGHAGQNIYLQVEALGLGTVVIGAFNDERVKEILGVVEEEPLYIMPVGHY